MRSRGGRGILTIILVLTLGFPPAFAQRGGRGGGGRGGGGGGVRGGGGGGGIPRGGGGFAGGGGLSRSPAVSSPRPAQRPALGGGAGGRPSTLPGGPPGGVGRPGVGPGAGRPATLPAGPGLGNRPQIGGQPGIGNRPGVGGQPGIGNRPGIDNRPGIGNRPGIDNRPDIGNRPGIDNRPGIGNRPGIDNRPGSDNRPGGGNYGNRPVDPGYGVRPPAYNGWRGAYWGYHQGWANGYWHGYHDNSNWGWGSFALGAATGVTAWALGSSFYNWGYASYANPYYAEAAVAQPIVIEQTVAGGEPQTVTVPAYTYDYSRPIDTQSAPPPAEVADPAVAKFDSARAAFGTGDYAGALKLTDEALKVLPNDATLHEFRALVLFAVGKYDLAAGPLYAVLSVGPGWDWTTMAGLYPNIDVYTSQLRKLEAFVSANLTSTAGNFVLAYHYLTQGNTEAAVIRLKQVVALAPQDTLSAQLVKQFSPPTESSGTPARSTTPAPATAPTKQGNLVGNWSAHAAGETTIDLHVGDDETFTWKVNAMGKPRQLTGKWSLANGVLTLAQDGDAGAMVGRVTWQADDKWTFRAIGTGPEDQGLVFTH
jgi:tetratricopeptide (TPR) repeat protein